MVLDALLDILIVGVEEGEAVVGAVAGVVVGDDGLEGGFLFVRFLLVIGLFLRQVFLDLLDIPVTFSRGEKTQAMLRGRKAGSAACLAAWMSWKRW